MQCKCLLFRKENEKKKMQVAEGAGFELPTYGAHRLDAVGKS